MNGIIIINKPSGPTSFAIVAQVKRITGEKRVGHGGTLDPLASGVLPVFLGQATRLVEYLQEYPKTYRAGIMLGVTTDTYDAEGQVVSLTDLNSQLIAQSSKQLPSLLSSFLGVIQQTPPAFSALKKDGKPLYKLARQGLAPEMEARPVTIYRLEIVDFQSPLLTLDVECSRGTYIRSLAHDLGQKLGVGAHLKTLVRTAYGPFNITNAVTLEQLQAALGDVSPQNRRDHSVPTQSSYITEISSSVTLVAQSPFLYSLDSVLSSWRAVSLTPEQERDLRNGKQLPLDLGGEKRARAYSQEGRFVAVISLDVDTGLYRPDKVFA